MLTSKKVHELTQQLLIAVTAPAALAALLNRLGPDAACELDPADIECRLDRSCSRDLLGLPPEGSPGTPTDLETLAQSPWARVVAALSDDPDTLALLTQAALLADRPIGWLRFPDLAARLVTRAEFDTHTRFLLAGLINPYDQDPAVKDLLGSPPATREVAKALLEAGCRLGSPRRLLDPILESADDLGSDTAIWLLEQLAKRCSEPGTAVAYSSFFDRPDLLATVDRPEPEAGASPRPQQLTEAFTLRLVALVAAHEDSCRDCAVINRGWAGLFALVTNPTFTLPAPAYDPIVGLRHGRHALGQREDLTAAQYVQLADAALSHPKNEGLRALATNAACPPALLKHGPAEILGSAYLARLAVSSFGDDPAPYLALVDLTVEDRATGLSAAAVLELAAQIAH